MMKDVAAVVVTYNRKKLLLENIDCLLKQSYSNLDILIIDNNSTDGTYEDLVPFIQNKKIIYRNTGENLGGAGGFQYGIKLAVESGYKYVWVMDDDTMPLENSLKKLMEADEILRGEYGFLSSAVLWTDGKVCRMNRQKIHETYYEHIELMKYGIVSVQQATFVSMLVPAKVVKEVGLPIKEFFIWGDDVEYTRRIAIRKKMLSYLVGQSQVIHATKNNYGSSIASDSTERIDRYRYAYRNEAYLYRKEGIKGSFYYFAKCILNFGRIIKSSAPSKGKRCGVLISSMFKGLIFNPKIEFPEKK